MFPPLGPPGVPPMNMPVMFNPLMLQAMQAGMDPSMFAGMDPTVAMQGMMAMQPPDMMGAAMAGHADGGGGGQVADASNVYFKTRICKRWQEGKCNFGETCRYAHGDADLRKPTQQALAQVQGQGSSGQRRSGAGSSGAGAVGASPGGAAGRVTHSRIMTPHGVVTTLIPGTGPAGSGAGGAVPPGGATTGGAKEGRSYHKTRLCERFMTTGDCPYGSNCTFAHGEHELRAPPARGGGAGGASAAATSTGAPVQQSHGGVIMTPTGPLPPAGPPPVVGAKRAFDGALGTPPVGGGAGGYGGEPGKRARGSAAATVLEPQAPVEPPEQEQLPSQQSMSLPELRNRFERLKNECARFAADTGHSVALFAVGGTLGDAYDSAADDFAGETYVRPIMPRGEDRSLVDPALRLAVLKYGTGGVSAQLVRRPEIVKFVHARGSKALEQLAVAAAAAAAAAANATGHTDALRGDGGPVGNVMGDYAPEYDEVPY